MFTTCVIDDENEMQKYFLLFLCHIALTRRFLQLWSLQTDTFTDRHIYRHKHARTQNASGFHSLLQLLNHLMPKQREREEDDRKENYKRTRRLLGVIHACPSVRPSVCLSVSAGITDHRCIIFNPRNILAKYSFDPQQHE